MILEIADITIDPVNKNGFEQAVIAGITAAIAPAKGFRGYKLNAGVEKPGRYILMIYWETLENHTHVGPFFLQPPVVEHFTLASKS
jgi:heme-degrading monooxygenase HmoA